MYRRCNLEVPKPVFLFIDSPMYRIETWKMFQMKAIHIPHSKWDSKNLKIPAFSNNIRFSNSLKQNHCSNFTKKKIHLEVSRVYTIMSRIVTFQMNLIILLFVYCLKMREF